MTRTVLLAAVGLGMFVMAAVGTLAVEGKLNREGLSSAGLLARLFPAPAKPPVKAPAPDSAGGLAMLHPFSTEEINQLIKDLQEQRRALEQKRKDLAVTEERLASFRKDQEERKKELTAERQHLAEQATALDKRETEMNSRILLVKQSEEANLKKIAAVYEGMGADTAAQILAKMEEGAAAKVLSRMEDRKTAKILEALPADAAVEISDRLRNMVKQDDTAKPE